MTGVIEGPQYEQTRKALRENPHVQGMGDELVAAIQRGEVHKDQFVNAEGEPRYEFMLIANKRFHELDNGAYGGPLHIGGVAQVLAERLRDA